MPTAQEAYSQLDLIEEVWERYNYGDTAHIAIAQAFLDMMPEGIPYPFITSEFRNPAKNDFTQVLVLLWMDADLCRAEGMLMFTSVHIMADSKPTDEAMWYTINGITGEERTHSLDLLSFPSYLTDTIKAVLGLS